MPNRTVLMVDGKPVTVIHDGQLSDDDRDALMIFMLEYHFLHGALPGRDIEITEVSLWPET